MFKTPPDKVSFINTPLIKKPHKCRSSDILNKQIPLKRITAILLAATMAGCSPYHHAKVKARQYSKQHPKTSVSAHRPLPRKKTVAISHISPLKPLLEARMPDIPKIIANPQKIEPAQAKPAELSASQILAKIYSAGLSQRMVSSASLAAAYSSYSNAVLNGSIKKGKFVVVDFTKQSNVNRLALVNFETGEFLGAIKVMHGSGSGDLKKVQRVSNIQDSYATPGGLLRICGTNPGSWEGWLLEGLEARNNKSRARDILLHMLDIPAANVDQFPEVQTYGCLGVNYGDAWRIGLPVARSEITRQARQEWIGRGIYVYFPSGANK
jgi:hypothetical protein